MTLVRHSGISEDLEECLLIGGRQFYIYGDTVYILRAWTQTAFYHVHANASQRTYNVSMILVRVSVERNCKGLKQMWTRNDLSHLLTVRRFPVSPLYNVNISMNSTNEISRLDISVLLFHATTELCCNRTLNG